MKKLEKKKGSEPSKAYIPIIVLFVPEVDVSQVEGIKKSHG